MNQKKNAGERKHEGFTLVEFLMSTVVAILILGGVVMALLYLTLMNTSWKKQSLVFQDAQLTMERISGTTFGALTTQFAAGQPLTSSFVTNVLGGYKIPGEVITITYPNGATSNPKEILVTGTWPEKNATQSVLLRTYRRG